MIDLHLHLDGSVSPKTLIKIAQHDNIELPSYTEEELKLYLVCPKSCQSLNKYLTKFELPGRVMQTRYGLYTVAYDLVETLANQGLLYAEIRFAPQLHLKKGLTQAEVVEAVLEGIKAASEKNNIKTQVILCLMRGKDNHKENLETVKVAKHFFNKGVCAIDLAGAEALFKTREFDEEFALARKLNLPFTIHAGEADDISSIKCAIEFGAKRIGHGIRAVDEEEFMNLLASKNIGLEMCPTSNLQTKAIKSLKEYPLREYLHHHILATINTDNMMVSNTTIKDEFELLEKKYNLTVDEKKQLLRNAVNIAFLDSEEKKKLLKRMGL